MLPISQLNDTQDEGQRQKNATMRFAPKVEAHIKCKNRVP